MADTPILNYKGKHDGPEIDKAVELALGLENPKSCPYYVHISLSQPDYVLTIGLGDAEGNLFNHAEIDLPLESMVVNATYENGNIILHLQDGTSTEPIPISALIAGLVSENRTVAGIDLKDNITPKELRDALDVYTKDSVDQLVSDLEDRIDETLNEMKQSLNDLDELTSEHDTQIKKNTSDIAINRTTLGMQCKNLLSVNDGTATRFIDKIINQIEPGKYILSIGELTSTDVNSSICLCLFTDSYNTPLSNNIHLKRGTDISATVTINEPATKIRIYASNDWNNSDGDTVTASNIMLRPADVTDPTYEPYKPSVNERLVEVEETVSELTPQVEQNKSDISSVANNVATTNAKAGTSTTNTLSSVGWHRIFAAERQQFARSGILMINRAFGNREPESHTILFNITQGRAVLELLNKNVEKQSISKLRLVHASSSPQSKACYFDIYYNETGENKITSSIFCESIVNTGAGSSFMNSRFVASSLPADIPEGYTSTELSLTNGDFLDRLTALETALSQTTE